MDPVLRAFSLRNLQRGAVMAAEDPSGPPLELPELEELPDPSVGTPSVGRSGPDVTGANPNPVVSVDVSPSYLTLNAPAVTRWALNARATYKAGTVRDVTELVTWSSSAPEVVSVDAAGVVTTHGAGRATVRAELDGRSGESAVTVVLATTTPAKPAPSGLGAVPWWGWLLGAGALVAAGGLVLAAGKKGRNS